AKGVEKIAAFPGPRQPLQHQVQRGAMALLNRVAQLRQVGPEARAAVQMTGRLQIPRLLVVRFPRLPRRNGINLIQGRKRHDGPCGLQAKVRHQRSCELHYDPIWSEGKEKAGVYVSRIVNLVSELTLQRDTDLNQAANSDAESTQHEPGSHVTRI